MLAEVRDYSQLHAALRARSDELQMTRESLDAVSGLQSGYSAKLLAPVPIKHLGPQSLGPILGALGLKLIIAEDAEALARITRQIGKRSKSRNDANRNVLTAKRRRRHRFPKGAEHARIMRSRGILKLTDSQRKRIATKAARVRWARVKAEREARRNAPSAPVCRAAGTSPTVSKPAPGQAHRRPRSVGIA